MNKNHYHSQYQTKKVLKTLKPTKIRFKIDDFDINVRALKRPYYHISEKLYKKLYNQAEIFEYEVDGEWAGYITYGDADGGKALMPVAAWVLNFEFEKEEQQ